MLKTKNATNPSLAGAIAPVPLPLNPAGEIDFSSLGRLLEYLLRGGVHGLWMNGTTGEFFALEDAEAAQVVAFAVKQARGRVPVIAQVGDASTRRAVVKAKQACGAGADFLSILLPYYLDYSQIELQRYLTAVSQAVQRPLVLYHMPQTCKVGLTIPAILELARDGVLLGIKDSSGNLEFYRLLAHRVREEGLSFQLLSGSSMLMDASLLVGGHGFVSGITNIVPHVCRQLYELAQQGQWAAVAAGQNRIWELAQALRLPSRSNLPGVIGAFKWILRELGLFAHDWTFPPFEPLNKSETMFLYEGALPLAKQLCGKLLTAPVKPAKSQPRAAGARVVKSCGTRRMV